MSFESQSEEFKRALAESAWLLRMNQPQAALEKLLPLYEQAPTHPDVALNLGGAYILMAKWRKAEQVLSKAAELHADNAMIWVNLAAAHPGATGAFRPPTARTSHPRLQTRPGDRSESAQRSLSPRPDL